MPRLGEEKEKGDTKKIKTKCGRKSQSKIDIRSSYEENLRQEIVP